MWPPGRLAGRVWTWPHPGTPGSPAHSHVRASLHRRPCSSAAATGTFPLVAIPFLEALCSEDDHLWARGDWLGAPDPDVVHQTTKKPFAPGQALATSKLRRVLIVDDRSEFDYRPYVYVCPRTTKIRGSGMAHDPHHHGPGAPYREHPDDGANCLVDLGGEVLVGWPVEKERLFSRARWSCHEPDETGLLGDLDRRGWSG